MNRHSALFRARHGVIYSHHHFYEPRLRLWGRNRSNRLDLQKILQPVPELATIGTEKGQRVAQGTNKRQDGSLFDLLDNVGRGTSLESRLRGVNILVCDDMGTEMADFVAVDSSQRRAIFIHAKAFVEARRRSASSFQEVCGQAVKNLEYLNPFSVMQPAKLTSWNAPLEAPWRRN